MTAFIESDSAAKIAGYVYDEESCRTRRSIGSYGFASGEQKRLCGSTSSESRYGGSGSIARRLAGINHAFQEAGIRQGHRLFAEGPLEQFELGFSVTQEFLQSSRPPTAVIALTDVIAVGTLHAAWKAGLSLPRDLSVTGFDDVPLARYTMPELTTAAQPVFEMGKQAALRLLRRISKPDVKARRTLLPTSIVIRSSTAPA